MIGLQMVLPQELSRKYMRMFVTTTETHAVQKVELLYKPNVVKNI